MKEIATFMLAPATKDRLESLKAKLRRLGLPRSVATESAIVETLIKGADADTLYKAFGGR